MAVIQLPIELLALNAEFNKKIQASTANVKKLDAETKLLNRTVRNTGSAQALKGTATLNSRMQALGKTYEISSKQIRIATDKNQTTFKRLNAVLSIVARNFSIFRRILLPLGLALFATNKILRKFRISVIISIIRLRLEILKSVALMVLAFNRLRDSKSLPEFLANLTRFSERAKRSFNGIIDSATRAGDVISDPSPFNNFIDFSVKASLVAGTFAFALKKIGPVVFGTNKLTTIFARSVNLFGSTLSVGTLRLNTFANSLASNNKIVNLGLKGFRFGTELLRNFTLQFVRFGNVLERSGSFLVALNQTGLKPFSKFIRNTLKTTSQFTGGIKASAKQTELFSKSLFGTTSRISTLGVGLVGLGLLLKQSENSFIRFLGSVSEFVGLLLGPVTLLVSRLIAAIGGLIQATGDKLVAANQSAAASFQEAESKAFIFNRTLEKFGQVFPALVGTTEEWNKEIDLLNKRTGESIGNLRLITAELIETGSSMNLNREQVKLLTRASVDFAKQIKGDSVQASIDFVSALNGNSQSVQKYGIALSAASVQLFLTEKGIRKTFKSMTEQEKIQARLAALTQKYEIIQGLAEATTSTFAGTTVLFNTKLKQLVTTYGQGANVVENFSLTQRLGIAVIEQLDETVVKVTGFLGALGGRFLQITGIGLKFIFTIALITTSYKALNTLLASQIFQRSFFAKIPFFNKSLANLVSSLGVTNLKIKSLGDVMKVSGQIIAIQAKRMIISILGIESGVLSLRTVMGGLIKRTIQLNVVLLRLAFNPITLTIAAIIAVGILLIKTLKIIEQETGLVTRGIDFLKDTFGPLIAQFTSASGVLAVFQKVFTRVFGVLVALTTKTIAGLSLLVSILPDIAIDEKTRASFKKAGDELNNLSARISSVGFDIAKLKNQTEAVRRSIAGEFKLDEKNTLPKDLKKLSDQLEKAGRTQLEKAKIQRDERLALVATGFQKERELTEKALGAKLTLIFERLEQEKITGEQSLQLRLDAVRAFQKDSSFIEKEDKRLRLETLRAFNVEFEKIELDRRNRLVAIAARFGGVEALTVQKQLELEQLQIAFDEELLTRKEFENAKVSIEISAQERLLATKRDGELRGLISSNSIRLLDAQNQKDFLQEKLKDEKISVEARIALERKLNIAKSKMNRAALNVAGNFFGDLMTLTAGSSRGLFELAKASSLAIAIVKGFQSVQVALASAPPPISFALGAAAAIRAAVQVKGIASQNFQKGITQVPKGFPEDTFNARLTTGERVVSAPQNRDLTTFLAKQGNSQTESILKDGFEALVQEMKDMNERLDNLENETVVNIGNREIVREVREGLRAGRSLVG